MSLLLIYDEKGNLLERVDDYQEIVERLKGIGVILEKWPTKDLDQNAGADEVLSAYKEEIERINRMYNFQSIDVVSVTPDHPKKEELRNMFLREHTHSDFEVRFFVYGCGTFYLHVGDKVYAMLCEDGDFISVPANTTHWFDMGTNPNFKAIRFFSIKEGWVGNFTGSSINELFPTHDEILSLR